MKCPFRKITMCSKHRVVNERRQEGGFRTYGERVPCCKHEADQIIEDFADCLKIECPYYREGDVCTKIQEV